METPRYRQMVPTGADTEARGYLQELEFSRVQDDRPYVLANFVASVDGHTTVAGDSRRLSAAGDRAMFYALRERVDAVLVGPRTLAAERYKRMLPAAERRDRRAAAGRPPEPLAVTVTRSGELDREIPLFTDTPENVLVFHATELPQMLSTLRRKHQIETLLCEGGPTLFAALLRERLVDELFLTLAPTLVGGASGPAVVSGPPPVLPAQLELASVLELDGALFLRYLT